MRISKLTVLTAIFVCAASAAHAQPVTITRIKGEVQIRRANSKDWVVAEPDFTLEKGDRIRTLKNGKAELLFPVGTLLMIKEESEVQISKAGDGKGGGSVKTILGAVLLNIKQGLDPGSTFEIDGLSALGVVRGTVLRVEVDVDTTSYWHGFESPVEVSNEQGRWTMEAGTNCRVDPFGKPIPGGCRTMTLPECIREFAIDETDEALAAEIERKLSGEIPSDS
ncbi:MAG: FecR domain-containing protein [bacterium]|jgi:hypothetical protein